MTTNAKKISNDYRVDLLNDIKNRNLNENKIFFNLVKSNNRLFESYNLVKLELSESRMKIQKLEQENLDLVKSSSIVATNTIAHDKIRELEEKLLKSKDEMIELQKKLVDQAQHVILLNRQLKEKNDELSIRDSKYNKPQFNTPKKRMIDVCNRYQNLKAMNREFENKISAYEDASKLWHDEKVELEMQNNCLTQKFEKLKEDYQHILTASLKFREEQIDRINKQNELENERVKIKLKEELENACQMPLDQNSYTVVNP